MRVAILAVNVDPQLKELVGQAADADGLTMNEYVAKVLAEHLGKPELAAIPRRSFGRPRKVLQPA